MMSALTVFAQVPYSDEGLAALIFTSEGDMRQAINNLQSTYSGFNFISPDNVFKVCDQPHPIIVKKMLGACQKGDVDLALDGLRGLWDQGYSAVDIVVTIFRVTKTMDESVRARRCVLHGIDNLSPQIARVHETGIHQGKHDETSLPLARSDICRPAVR
jgi:DNA polymerase III delta prime subunit